MSTKYLRKIILEELEEVLKEVVVPAGMSLGEKPKSYHKSLIPGESQKIFFPTLQNTQRNAKKVLSAINGRSIIAGYTPCGNEIVGLKRGCMGKGVLKLQSMLKTAHDNMSAATKKTTEPEIDGYFGPRTETSLNSFLKLAGEPPLTGAITGDMLGIGILAESVPSDFSQRYDVAYQQLKSDYLKQLAGQAMADSKFGEAEKKLEAASDPNKRIFNIKDQADQAPATTGPQSDLGKCPDGRKRNPDGTCPGSELNKPIDKTPLKRESLIKKEIAKLLRNI